jgi:AcrR family transcriptional regulator
MAHIAEAVEVQPSALYRHFLSKDDLLYQVVETDLQAIQRQLSTLSSSHGLAETALEHRAFGVLWQREARHLAAAAREELRALLLETVAAIAAFVAHGGGDRPAADCNLLAWACLDVAASLSFQRVELPAGEYVGLLEDIVDRVVATRLNSQIATAAPAAAHAELDRRDELLAVAARLFAQRGYGSVGVDDVAAAVGMAGPSLYHHFATKLDLIVAVITRGADQILDLTARALANTGDPAAALDAQLGAYIEFSLAHTDLMDLLITEVPHLPDPHRSRFLAIQRRYLGDWLTRLEARYPRRPRAHLRVYLQAALTVINDVARTPHLRARPSVAADMDAIAHAILSP